MKLIARNTSTYCDFKLGEDKSFQLSLLITSYSLSCNLTKSRLIFVEHLNSVICECSNSMRIQPRAMLHAQRDASTPCSVLQERNSTKQLYNDYTNGPIKMKNKTLCTKMLFYQVHICLDNLCMTKPESKEKQMQKTNCYCDIL